MHPPDDRLLLAQAADGDPAAIEELVRRHAPLVLAACRRQLPGADADDAAQAVFLVLWRRARQAAGSPGLRGWLVVTAQHVCANARRSAVRRRTAERVVTTLQPAASAGDAAAMLDEALSALPAPKREVVVRRHLLGEDPAATAAALGCAEGTVRSDVDRTGRLVPQRAGTWVR